MNGTAAPGPVVVTVDETAAPAAGAPDEIDALGRLARAVLVAEGVELGELTLTFVDPADMAAVNHEYMGEDRPTDVLAFPIDDPRGKDPTEVGLYGEVLLGDVLVCPDVAAANAAAHGVETGAEIELLVVHGVLHVLGMDHAEPGEAAAMQAAERRHLASWRSEDSS